MEFLQAENITGHLQQHFKAENRVYSRWPTSMKTLNARSSQRATRKLCMLAQSSQVTLWSHAKNWSWVRGSLSLAPQHGKQRLTYGCFLLQPECAHAGCRYWRVWPCQVSIWSMSASDNTETRDCRCCSCLTFFTERTHGSLNLSCVMNRWICHLCCDEAAAL